MGDLKKTHIGRYEIVRRLRGGSVSNNYEARDPTLSGPESVVYLRQLVPHFVQADPELVTSFLLDARAAAALRHPNIIRVLDHGRVDDDCIVATEWVDGVDVHEMRQAIRWREGEWFPVPAAVDFVIGVARAVHAIGTHEDESGAPNGFLCRTTLVHAVRLTFEGDVKTSVLGWQGRVYPTNPGGILGPKISYLSPEMVGGQTLDLRSDVYLLGILLFWMLTGKNPANGESDFETLERTRTGRLLFALKLKPELDVELVRILERALALSRDDRYPTAEELALALERWRRERDPRFLFDGRRLLLAWLFPEKLAARSLSTELPPEFLSWVNR